MAQANIKLSTREIKALKKYTEETTGQKAVHKAVLYFIKEARQKRLTQSLQDISFKPGFNPLKLRHGER